MGWYLSYGKNLLVRSGSDVTGAVYRRVREDHLVSHCRTWYRNNWLLADDNARPHRDRVLDAYLHEQDIILMDWAPYRPDMNSIEHMWDVIGRGLEEFGPSVSEPEATGSCSPKSTATDPSGKSPDLG